MKTVLFALLLLAGCESNESKPTPTPTPTKAAMEPCKEQPLICKVPGSKVVGSSYDCPKDPAGLADCQPCAKSFNFSSYSCARGHVTNTPPENLAISGKVLSVPGGATEWDWCACVYVQVY